MEFKYKLPENCPEQLINEYGKINDVYMYRFSEKKEFDINEFLPHLFGRKPKYKQIQKDCKDANNKWKKTKRCCKAAGLSVFRIDQSNEEDIFNEILFIIDTIPALEEYIYIFRAKIDESMGVLIETGGTLPFHCEFFIYKGQEEEVIFEFFCQI